MITVSLLPKFSEHYLDWRSLKFYISKLYVYKTYIKKKELSENSTSIVTL